MRYSTPYLQDPSINYSLELFHLMQTDGVLAVHLVIYEVVESLSVYFAKHGAFTRLEVSFCLKPLESIEGEL